MNTCDPVTIGIVSISDRASSGAYEDKGLPALQEWLGRALKNPIRFEPRLIPDEQVEISRTLIELVDAGCALVLTTGGTGQSLIINLPWQPKAIAETLEGLKDADGRPQVHGIFAAVPYCIDLIGGPYLETDETVCKAFRPKNAQRPIRA